MQQPARYSMKAATLLAIATLLAGCGGSSGDGPAPPNGGNQLRSATLSWSAPTANTNGSQLNDLTGYRIYYGTSPSLRDNTVDISNPSVDMFVIENLSPAVYYFSVRALNGSDVESADSNVVTADLR